MNILADELRRFYEEIMPMEFYREIFPNGELDEWRESPTDRTEHKYTGILVEVTKEKKKDGKQYIKRYTITNEMFDLDRVIKEYRINGNKNFCIMAPISYIGKQRTSQNARIMYALVVELDNLVVKGDKQQGLYSLIKQWGDDIHWIPKPTYTVASGNGLHLYYVFEQGIPLFPNVVESLAAYKRVLTKMIWNRHTTKDFDEDKIQYESIFQAFRVVGTATKKGDAVQAFKTGERVSIEYMNSFIVQYDLKKYPKAQITQIYKSELTLEQAKNKYPDWYEKRVERKEPKGHWICKRDLYDWWKRRIKNEAVVGHRYYCLMMLSIYAIKCDIKLEELEKDCFELAEIFEKKTTSEDNHFTLEDVQDALQAFYDKGLITYPVNSISNRSGIEIKSSHRPKGKRLKQAEHLKLARFIRDEINGNVNWREGNGRKPKQDIVSDWRIKNPMGKKADCIKETGLAKATVYKWWDKI